MMTIEEIREKLHGLNYSRVARDIGVTRAYISALAKGKRDNPSYQVLKRMSKYFGGRP